MSEPAPGTRARGAWAERCAENHLAQHGLHTVARNYHCRRGELDLVCVDGESMVFVEVRYRRRNAMVSALESITYAKQLRVRIAAENYLANHPVHAMRRCRFDVVTVTGHGNDIEIQWIRDAFQIQ